MRVPKPRQLKRFLTLAQGRRVIPSAMSEGKPPDRPTRRAVARDERRAQLLTAAREVFSKKGYHAATVDDITKAAGVAKGTFYLYFQEKREVYYEVVRTFLDLVKEAGRSVAIEHAGGPDEYAKRSAAAAQKILELFRDNQEVAKLAYRESMGLDAELEKMIRDFYREIAQVEAANIKRGIELGMMRPDLDPMLAAYAHIGMVERLMLASLDEHSGLPLEPGHVALKVLELAWQGMRKDA